MSVLEDLKTRKKETGKEKQEPLLVVLILDGFVIRQLDLTTRLLHVYTRIHLPIYAIEKN